MQIYYWCPFLTNIATINAVKNSAFSLKKYTKASNKLTVKILNSFGEWNFLKKNNQNIDIVDMQKINLHKFFPKQGFFFSRFTFLIIFILNFLPLLKLIKKNRPNYLIIHLLTILPIILSPILSKNTKIILRISGLPKMNFFRKFIWKFFSKYIFLITTPTHLTKLNLKKQKIFPDDKIKILRDPVINHKIINILKNKKIKLKDINENFYLAIGRLTVQKNFSFLIKNFLKNIDRLKIKRLIIIGDGEEYKKLNKLIYANKAENNVFLLGYKKNVYNFIHKSSALISSALYEDPGFALIEACYMKKKIICSLVPNGPLEMRKHSNMCYFFKNNNSQDFIKKIILSEKDFRSNIKVNEAFNYAKNFTIFAHYKNLINLLR